MQLFKSQASVQRFVTTHNLWATAADWASDKGS